MNILFLSRKRTWTLGGLRRFTIELIDRTPRPHAHIIVTQPFPVTPKALFEAELIHCTDATLLPAAAALSAIRHIPYTVTAHGLDLTYPPAPYQHMLRILLPRAHAVILDSVPARGLLTPFAIRNERIHVIAPGISTDHLKHTTPVSLPPLPKGSIIMITIGNLKPRKGHLWFLTRVLPRLPAHFHWWIIGDGQTWDELKTATEEFGLQRRVTLFGQLDNPKTSFLLRHADIYVKPNQHIRGDFEGFGLAAGEAAALGLPVVATAVDGIPDAVINGKNGILCPPEPEAFARAIRKFENIATRRAFGKKAREFTLKKYRWSLAVSAYQTVFSAAKHMHSVSHAHTGST